MNTINNVLWVRQFRSTSPDTSFSIAPDASGNIGVTYVTGDSGITNDNDGNNYVSGFVSGFFSDKDDNSYVSGFFSGTATFDNITLTSAANNDAFITKLDSSGNFLWAKKFGGTSDDEGYRIMADEVGNIIVSGNLRGTVSFGSTTLTSTGDFDTFIAKLDTNGNVLSAQKLGGVSDDVGISLTNGGSIMISAGDLISISTVRQPKITLAPNNNIDSVFNLTGAGTPVQFLLKSASPGVVNEIGLFTVDDDKGTIDGIAPNDSNYTQAAIARSRSIFSTLGNSPNGFDTNLTRTLDLDAGIRFRLLLVQNGTLDGLRNGTVPPSQLRLSSPTSLQVSDVGNSNFDLRFEDSPGSGQFNDAVVQMQLGTQADKLIGTALQDRQEGEVLDLRGLIGTQNATFTVNREAAFNNFVGFFRVADAKGGTDTNSDGIGDLLPGQAGYGEAAVKNRVGGIDLSVGNQGKATFTGQFEAGSVFAPFLIVNGTPDQLLDSNANNNPAIYFPYLGANSDKVDHVRMLGNNVFGFEDLTNGGDKDFNDIIVSVKFN